MYKTINVKPFFAFFLKIIFIKICYVNYNFMARHIYFNKKKNSNSPKLLTPTSDSCELPYKPTENTIRKIKIIPRYNFLSMM